MIPWTYHSLAAKLEVYARTPFPLLVRLFMNRILCGSNAGDGELHLSMGLVLQLLAVPGGFVSILLFDKYGSFLQWLRVQTHFDPLAAALADEYFFIVLSMVVTGGAAVWWWDSIFPDRRDFANLVPLPISTSHIFLANAVAILLLACLLTIDVNAASSILFPAIVGASQTFRFVAQFAVVHVLVVVLASIFSFFAVFATVGVLMLVLPYPLFRRISLYIRSFIVLSLLAALFTSFMIPRMIPGLLQSSHSPLRLLPSVWFVGFCQLLRGKADPALAQLGHLAVVAVVFALLVAAAAYALSYRRCFLHLPELSDTPAGSLGVRTSWVFRLLDLLILHTPFQRAGYRFVVRTLLRREAQALTLGGFAGLGIVGASRVLFSAFNGEGLKAPPSAEMLSIPLVLNYCLLIGIRFIFDLPADLSANWTFRFLLDRNTHESVALARRLMLSFVLPWVFVIAFPIYLHFWGWRVALFHTTLVAMWSVLLTEVLLIRFRKLPFTCTYPPFEHSAVVAVIAYVFGFFAFAGVTSELELEVLLSPVIGIVLLVTGLAVWGIVHCVRQGVAEIDNRLAFEDTPPASFELLHLADGG